MNVLVTDGDTRASLAIVRSLGRRGHQVTVGAQKHPCLASSSRYCSSRVTYSDPAKDIEGFLRHLAEAIHANRVDVILPVTDITTLTVTQHRARFEDFSRIPFASSEVLRVAASKDKICRLAEELGVPIPRTCVLDDKLSLSSMREKLLFPIVVKPARSSMWSKDGRVSTNIMYVHDRGELEHAISSRDSREFPILLQERVNGPGIGVFVCYNRGEIIAAFGHKRLREKPPSGGVSTLRESVPIHPAALEYTRRLLNHLEWHGVAMVEFKLDQLHGIPRLMEINGRFWGSLQLAIDSGIDFPAILIESVHNDCVAPKLEYRLGVKTRWFVGDLDALIMVMLKKRKNLDLPQGFPSRVKYLRSFLKLWEKDMHYEVESLSDIKPWVYEISRWVCDGAT